MAVARDDLRGHRLGLQSETPRHVRLHRRIDMGIGADGAADRADRNFRPCLHQPSAVAGEFGVVSGELQAEARRLRMDAMTASNGQRLLVLERALFQRGKQGVQVGKYLTIFCLG